MIMSDRAPVLISLTAVAAMALAGCANGDRGKDAVMSGDKTGDRGKATTAARPTNVLLNLTGSGTKHTKKFTTSGDEWIMEWSYDCANIPKHDGADSPGLFHVSPSGDNEIEVLGGSVNELSTRGAGVQNFHKGGEFFLAVNSGCNWKIVVKG